MPRPCAPPRVAFALVMALAAASPTSARADERVPDFVELWSRPAPAAPTGAPGTGASEAPDTGSPADADPNDAPAPGAASGLHGAIGVSGLALLRPRSGADLETSAGAGVWLDAYRAFGPAGMVRIGGATGVLFARGDESRAGLPLLASAAFFGRGAHGPNVDLIVRAGVFTSAFDDRFDVAPMSQLGLRVGAREERGGIAFTFDTAALFGQSPAALIQLGLAVTFRPPEYPE